jgi:hypothetical protein
MKNLAHWLKGLAAAVIGGVSNSIALIIVNPEHFNLQSGIKNLLSVAGTSAILSAAMYLKKSPLPSIITEEKA